MQVKFAGLIALLSLAAPFNVLAEQRPNTGKLSSRQARALELTADTPADHLRLATYYQEQVHRLAAKATYHEEMARMYRERPLPFDGKLAVPMQRHCKEWAARFDEQAERAALMAALHEYKASGQVLDPSALAHLARVSLGKSGFGTSTRVPAAGHDQVSLYAALQTASAHFYDQTRVLTYIVNANGTLPVAIPELRQSATSVFETQDRFLASLRESQLEGIKGHVSNMQILRLNIGEELNKLERQLADRRNQGQFKTAKKLKETMQQWHSEQREIGYELEIPVRLTS
jgi:hypothetical protein